MTVNDVTILIMLKHFINDSEEDFKNCLQVSVSNINHKDMFTCHNVQQ